jgi:colicin import membrane protein
MSAQTPGAYLLSVLLHGAVALLFIFFGYITSSVVQDTPKVFELVAGAGNNYAARIAPALGSPSGIKIAAAAPKPAETPKPEKAPIQPAPPEAVPAKPAKPMDMVAELKRVEQRRAKRLEAKYQKEQEAERKRITQQEFQRQQAAAKAGAKVSHVDAAGIREGVIGGSTGNKVGGAGGKALTREEGSELDAYFSLLKARIKESHVPPEGVSDTLEARVEFFVAADGSLSRFRIARASGNHEFDRSVIEACEHTRSIGARPDGRSEMVQMTFKMREDETP